LKDEKHTAFASQLPELAEHLTKGLAVFPGTYTARGARGYMGSL
jgi:hypothetical protein